MSLERDIERIRSILKERYKTLEELVKNLESKEVLISLIENQLRYKIQEILINCEDENISKYVGNIIVEHNLVKNSYIVILEVPRHILFLERYYLIDIPSSRQRTIYQYNTTIK